MAGYIRVSSPSQDYAYQRHAIELAARARGMTIDRWYADKASGDMQRPELERLRRALAAGELAHVWVWRLDRLSRGGIVDTLSIVHEIRGADATPHSVADGFAFDDGPTGELMLAVLAWAAQMELHKIRENQEAARARMRALGRRWGRKPMPQEKRDAIECLTREGLTPCEVSRRLEISTSSVHKHLAACRRQAAADLGLEITS